MATLTSRTVAESYPELLKLDSVFIESSEMRQVEDGVANPLPLQLSQTVVRVTGDLELTSAFSLAYPQTIGYSGTGAALTITSPLVSSSPSTGALVVTGGVGIGSNLYVGNSLNVVGASDFTGNARFRGDIQLDGVLTLKGNIAVGDANTDSITFNADVTSNILPDVSENYDLGSAGKSWRSLYIRDVYPKNLDVSQTVKLSPISGAGTVEISPTALTVSPVGTTSTLNNVTIGATTPRNGTFTNITQSGTTGVTSLAGTTDSTSSLTGSVLIAGGVGIQKSLNVGSNFSVASTGSNSATFNAPVNVVGAASFTNSGTTSLTINPPNTTTSPLRIANNGSDSVTVDSAGQLNALKTSVHTGKATFNGVAEVNNAFNQVNSTQNSTFAGPLVLNNSTSSLTVNGPTTIRGITGRNAANSATTLTFANDTGDLTTSRFVGTTALSIGASATTTSGPFYVTSTGYFNAYDGASIAAGIGTSLPGAIVLAGTASPTIPSAGSRYIRVRQTSASATDIATIDLGSGRLDVNNLVSFNQTGGSVVSHFYPNVTGTYDLGRGSEDKRWRHCYLTGDIDFGGRLYASRPLGTGTDHTIMGNLVIGGSVTANSVISNNITNQVSTGKTLTLNTPTDDVINFKVRQNLSSSAVGGGLSMAATYGYTQLNTVAAPTSTSTTVVTETITHDLGLTPTSVTANRADNGADVSAYFTWTATSTTSVTITWLTPTQLAAVTPTALTPLGTSSGAAGNILFTIVPPSSYGYSRTNLNAATLNTSETITHSLNTTAIKVTITNEQSGAVITNTPVLNYTVSNITTSAATITWNATQTPSIAGSYRIKVEPTANVQKYATFSYSTPSIGQNGSNPEGIWTSSEHIGLSTGKSFHINNTRVLSSDTLGVGVTKSSLTRVGIIGPGSTNYNWWRGNIVEGQYGGTGVANTGKTITLGGNLTTSGAFDTTFTSTAATSLTLPTTGTLATLAGSEIFSNKALSSNITVTPNALVNDLAVVDGGTGRGTLTQNGVLYGNGTLAVGMTTAGTDKQVLISSAGIPTFATISPTITLTGDVTGTGTMTDLGNVTINTIVGSDKVALGADTTGAYTESVVVSGSGLSISNATPLADGAQYTISSNATALNTASTLVFRDSSGNFAAGTITGNLSGNATTSSSAARWTTSRTLTLSGNITGSVTLDGSGDVTMSNTAYAAGSISNAAISATAAIADTKLATISTAGKVSNSATTAVSASGINDSTSTSLKNTIVSRDGSGNFTVNSITALTGFNGTASAVLDNVSRQRVKVSGFDSVGNAVTSEKDEIVFSSNSNCNVWVSTDPSNTKTNVQVFVPSVTTFVNDFNDANFLVSDDVTGGRIKFKLDSLSNASSSGSGTPRELIVSDTNQTLMGYTDTTPIAGTPGGLTNFPFLKWDSVPQAIAVQIAGQTSTDAPQTVYVPFYTP